MAKTQCPHCHNFKVRNEEAYYWSMASLLFVFGIPLLFAFGFGLIMWMGALIASVWAMVMHGKSRCLQCGWRGRITV